MPFFILAFSDGALKTRRTSMHVLHAGLGNYPDFIRNSQAAKSHIMFFQKGAGNKKVRHSAVFKRTDSMIYQRQWEQVWDPVLQFQNTGFEFTKKSGEKVWFVPRLYFVCNDSPEADSVNNTFGSWNCNFPCHICYCPGGQCMFEGFRGPPPGFERQIPPFRTVESTKIAIDQGRARDISVHPIKVCTSCLTCSLVHSLYRLLPSARSGKCVIRYPISRRLARRCMIYKADSERRSLCRTTVGSKRGVGPRPSLWWTVRLTRWRVIRV